MVAEGVSSNDTSRCPLGHGQVSFDSLEQRIKGLV